MLRRIAILSSIAIVFVALASLGAASPASAQAPGYDSTDGCTGSWQSQFGVNVLVLNCQPGFATAHDRAYMFARGPIDPGGDWHSQLDFTNSVWLFDAGAHGNRASLIIDFHREASGLVADFYDDTNGDGEVRYGYERGYPRSVETRFPSLRVIAPDGWWVRDGKVNYNLRLQVDGPIKASFHAEVFLDFVATDGYADVTSEVHDPTGSGRPQWQVVQAQPPVGDSSAILRTLLMVNTANDELPVQTYILWPHLGYFGTQYPKPDAPVRTPLWAVTGAGYDIVKNYNTSFPPIQVDWVNARIATIGELVASRGRAHNWFTYSILRIGTAGKTLANFENPFAFYDLAGANDGYPDLSVRDGYYVPSDPYTTFITGEPTHEIRYSWDLFHERHWKYKVDLWGRRPMPALVTVGNIQFRSVPYDEYPGWVVRNVWEAADFVASERPVYWTTEGIYPWCAGCTSAQEAYHAGLTVQKPTSAYDDIEVGFRGEYVTHLADVPRLYLSTVDHKVHLLGAEAGVWNIAENERIRYSAGSGPYIGRWEHTIDGIVAETLVHAGNRLVYADQYGVRIAYGPDNPSSAIFGPPSNSAEYGAMRELLANGPKPGEGSDLQKVFDGARGEVIDLPGVVAWDIQPAEGGVRFLASLPEPPPEIPATEGLQPGIYVASLTSTGDLTFQPARPAQIAITPPAVRGDAPAVLAPSRLTVEITNSGDEGLSAVPIAFFSSRPGEAGQVVASTSVGLPAGATKVVEVQWMPTAAGEWSLTAASLSAFGAVSAPVVVSATGLPPTDAASLLLSEGLRPFSAGAITASLTLAVAISAGVAYAALRHQAIDTTEDDHR